MSITEARKAKKIKVKKKKKIFVHLSAIERKMETSSPRLPTAWGRASNHAVTTTLQTEHPDVVAACAERAQKAICSSVCMANVYL